MAFFINEDIELLRLMGMDNATPEVLRNILPADVHTYYQTRLKNGTTADVIPATSGASTSRKLPGAPAYSPLSSPQRRAANRAGGAPSALRNQILMGPGSSSSHFASRPETIPASPKPIGHTGIFRRTGSSVSSTSASRANTGSPHKWERSRTADDEVSPFSAAFPFGNSHDDDHRRL